MGAPGVAGTATRSLVSVSVAPGFVAVTGQESRWPWSAAPSERATEPLIASSAGSFVYPTRNEKVARSAAVCAGPASVITIIQRPPMVNSTPRTR